MPDCMLADLRSVELGVPDVRADAQFYTDVWHLASVAEHEGSVYLRGTSAHHHILALHPRSRTELLSVTFGARSRSDVAAVHRAVKAGAAGAVGDPAPIAGPGGGYGFSFRDPEGRILRVIADAARHADVKRVPDRPERLAHIVLNSPDVPRATKYFNDVLGFKLSDRTARMTFLRNNSDHHSVAIAQGEAATLNHIAFLMPDLDSVMRGAGRMKDSGWPIEWGVGRHGPGNNVFAYFVGPHDVPIEYTSEVQQVDDGYRAGGPEDWKWPPGRTDRWGVTAPASERLHAAQKRISFSRETAAA